MSVRSVAKSYADVNSMMPESYWNYDNIKIKYGDIDQYALISRIGRGKYSEVFYAEDLKNKKDVVIKVLKPVRTRKILREISILSNLANGVNIINLIDVIMSREAKIPALVFDYTGCENAQALFPYFNLAEVKYYVFELLKALDYCHSKGIMHRDVKPHNIIIDPSKKMLRLIDWGLAEYYHPGQRYNVRVASRYFKGPELLVNFEEYDYSLDLWSTGCMLAGIVFKKDPFFHGSSNDDQLVKIVNVLGTNDFEKYLVKYNIIISSQVRKEFTVTERRSLSQFINNSNSNMVDRNCIDFLDQLLQYDHHKRLTAKEAMNHSFFSGINET